MCACVNTRQKYENEVCKQQQVQANNLLSCGTLLAIPPAPPPTPPTVTTLSTLSTIISNSFHCRICLSVHSNEALFFLLLLLRSLYFRYNFFYEFFHLFTVIVAAFCCVKYGVVSPRNDLFDLYGRNNILGEMLLHCDNVVAIYGGK